eukprot:3884885-Prymnesium_polylepis.1
MRRKAERHPSASAASLRPCCTLWEHAQIVPILVADGVLRALVPAARRQRGRLSEGGSGADSVALRGDESRLSRCQTLTANTGARENRTTHLVRDILSRSSCVT